jgi:2-iminobutanoate/2-iminopropanoate deaminase
MMKKAIKTELAPTAIGPYSQAMRMGERLFISGQLPIKPESGLMVEGIVAQTEQVFDNLEAILKSEGLSLAHLLKTTVFLSDMDNFTNMNEIYSKRVPAPYPARSTVQVAQLPKDALIEIEAIAYY